MNIFKVLFNLVVVFAVANSIQVINLLATIYKLTPKIPLVAEQDKLINCCGMLALTVNNTISIFDPVDCKGSVNCDNDKNFEHDFSLNNCVEGIPLSHGCVKTVTDQELEKMNEIERKHCFSFVECVSTDKGTFCPDRFYEDIIYTGGNKYHIDPSGRIIQIHGGNMSSGFRFAKVFMKACPFKHTITLKKALLKKGNLNIIMESTGTNNCNIQIGKEKHAFVCNKVCSTNINVEDKISNLKTQAVISCADWVEKFWIFREEKTTTFKFIETRAAWKSLSRSWLLAFIISAFLGYWIFRILVGVLYVSKSILYITYSWFYNFMLQSDYNHNKSNMFHCAFCENDLLDSYDALLHLDMCKKELCPYCKRTTSVGFSQHVIQCIKRKESIENIKKLVTKEEEERKRLAKEDIRNNIWRNKLTVYKIPTMLWIFSMILTFVGLMVAPSSAELSMPCTKILGEVTHCDSSIKNELLSTPEDHFKWSSIELSQLEELEGKWIGNEYQRNSIHRLKNEIKMFEDGSSDQSMILEEGACNENAVCKGSTVLEWSGNLKDYSMQKFTSRDKNYHKSSLHLLITGVETRFELEKLYYTTEWEFSSEDKFSCTESNCSRVCTNDKNSKCPSRMFSRSSDTAWTHNPYWCLSINTGCSCSTVSLKPKSNVPIFMIAETKKKYAHAVFCIEMNSAYIDCEIINGNGVYNMKDGRIIVSNWKINANLPKRLAIKMNPGSNNKYQEVYRVNACDKNHCKLGELGDFQMSDLNANCNDGTVFAGNLMDIEGSLRQNFMRTPKWEFSYPESYLKSNRFKDLLKSNPLENVNYNVSDGIITMTGSDFGSFDIKVEIRELELYQITNDFKLREMSVIHCTGYYGSEIGAICTFKVCIEGKTGTVKFESNDVIEVQDDYQTVIPGCNTVRKHMYVRTFYHSYSICAKAGLERKCIGFNGNFTENKEEFKLMYGTSFKHQAKEVFKICDQWGGLNCIARRIIDFFSTAWNDIIYILVFVAASVFIAIFISMIRRSSEGKLVLSGKQSNLTNRIMYMKDLGYKFHEK